MRSEATMREHAMEANAYTQDGEGVHDCKQYQVGPVHSPFPEQGDGQHGRQKRDENNTQDENLIPVIDFIELPLVGLKVEEQYYV